MKKKRSLILTILFLTINVGHSKPPCPATQPSHILKTLTDDLALYKTTNTDHEGHLIAHSIWTARTIDKWFKQKKFWTEGIDQKYHKTAVWGGFLHDIGKAGHFRSPYRIIPEHPSIGFHYLAGFTSNKLTHFRHRATNFIYHLTPPDKAEKFTAAFTSNQRLPQETLKKMVGKSNIEIYSFKKLFTELNFSQEEQNIISILSGIHWEFGHVMQHQASNASIQDYFVKLQELVNLTDYNNKIIDDTIVRLAMLITAADARSSAPEGLCIVSDTMLNHPSIAYDKNKTHDDYFINWENGLLKQNEEFESAYERFNYETHGKRSREKIIEYFKKHYEASREKSNHRPQKSLTVYWNQILERVIKNVQALFKPHSKPA